METPYGPKYMPFTHLDPMGKFRVERASGSDGVLLHRPYVNYGLNLGWGGPIGDYIRFWGDLLRDILQI